MGAAIIGCVGCGMFKSFDIADQFTKITEWTQPDPAPAPAYRRAKELLDSSYAALPPLFPRFGKEGAKG
jgi:xylulokinase